jgi:CheY-like chemotaxis protein
VLMDCHMPGLDGFECTRALRSQESASGAARLPIVGVSASTSREERARCAASGMDGFLPKPINLAAVGTLLQRWCTGAPAAADAPTPDPPVPATASALLDHAHLTEMRAAAGAEFARLVERFAESSREQLAAMQAARRRDDGARLRRAAHKLRGSAAALGAAALAARCADLERRARAGETIPAAVLDELGTLRESTCLALTAAAASGG